MKDNYLKYAGENTRWSPVGIYNLLLAKQTLKGYKK